MGSSHQAVNKCSMNHFEDIATNILINDITLFVNNALICNFADDNTLYASDNATDIIARKLESDMSNIFLIEEVYTNH